MNAACQHGVQRVCLCSCSRCTIVLVLYIVERVLRVLCCVDLRAGLCGNAFETMTRQGPGLLDRYNLPLVPRPLT